MLAVVHLSINHFNNAIKILLYFFFNYTSNAIFSLYINSDLNTIVPIIWKLCWLVGWPVLLL